MRGKDYSAARQAGLKRITPAYAGKSEFKNAAAGMDEDHPRLCGEKLRAVPPDGLFLLLSRITPAYAGKRIKRLVGKSTA